MEKNMNLRLYVFPSRDKDATIRSYNLHQSADVINSFVKEHHNLLKL